MKDLETKFVAANTLIGINKPKVGDFTGSLYDNQEIKKLEADLKKVRHKLFSSKTPANKRKLREDDKGLRNRIADLLISDGWENQTARQLASWDPYDQNESYPFFDPEWRFDIKNGFDIVIGNPSYIKEYTFKNAFDGIRNSPYFQGKMDIWYLFACKTIDYLREETGKLCFIATNNWTTNSGASKLRSKIINDTRIHLLLDFGSYMIFESADIQTMVMIFRKVTSNDKYKFELRRLVGANNTFNDVLDLITKKQTEKTEYLNPFILKSNLIDNSLTFSNIQYEIILDKVKSKSNFHLNESSEVAQGIVLPQDFLNKSNQKILGDNFKIGQGIFIINDDEKNNLDFNTKE